MDNVFATMVGQLNGTISVPTLPPPAPHLPFSPAGQELSVPATPSRIPAPTAAALSFRTAPPATFTPAEIRVLGQVILAKTDKEIGQALSISPFTAADTLKRIMEKTGIRSRVALTAHYAPPDPHVTGQRALLTRREREVINWVARGKTDDVIGQIMALSPATIGDHLKNAMQKTGRHRRGLLALLADPPNNDAATRPGIQTVSDNHRQASP